MPDRNSRGGPVADLTPPRGRPPLPEGDRLVKRALYLSPSTWAGVAFAAALAGVSVGAWLRRVVVEALGRDP